MIKEINRWSVKLLSEEADGYVPFTHLSQYELSRSWATLYFDDEEWGTAAEFSDCIITAQFEYDDGYIICLENCEGETYAPFMNIPMIEGGSDGCILLLDRHRNVRDHRDWGGSWNRRCKEWRVDTRVSRRLTADKHYFIIDDRTFAVEARGWGWCTITILDEPVKKKRWWDYKHHHPIDPPGSDPLQDIAVPRTHSLIKVDQKSFRYTRFQWWYAQMISWGQAEWGLWPFNPKTPEHVAKHEQPYWDSLPFPPPLRAYDGPLSSKGLPWGFELWWAAKKGRLKRLFGRDKS